MMTHVLLVHPILGENFWSSSYAILKLIGHFYCVTEIKHSLSLMKNGKLHMNLKIRKFCERDLLKYW